jgi:hypothetical protein
MTDPRLSALRAAAERCIDSCDAQLRRTPDDPTVAERRRRFARVAMRFHAVIERQEARDVQAQVAEL